MVRTRNPTAIMVRTPLSTKEMENEKAGIFLWKARTDMLPDYFITTPESCVFVPDAKHHRLL